MTTPHESEYVLELRTRHLVERAVDLRWPDFAARHPRLAAALGESASVRLITADLLDDPMYGKALRDAQVLGNAAQVADRWVRWFVGQWLPTTR